jgi:hypothetical protein
MFLNYKDWKSLQDDTTEISIAFKDQIFAITGSSRKAGTSIKYQIKMHYQDLLTLCKDGKIQAPINIYVVVIHNNYHLLEHSLLEKIQTSLDSTNMYTNL